MISMLYKYLTTNSAVKQAELRRKNLEDTHKLSLLLKDLRRDNSPERSAIYEKPHIETNWNCLKKEGVITSLDESGGVINGKYKFAKLVAKHDWNNLKVGTKLKFLLFEGYVRQMELLDSWFDDDEEVIIPANEDIAGYNTDLRTVTGTISKIEKGILTIELGEGIEQLIALEDYPETKWQFIVGDNLSLQCIIQEDDTSWNPNIGMYGNILSVQSFKPNLEKTEFGTVTGVYDGYSILDETVVLDDSIAKKKVKACEEYEYEAIETSCMIQGRNFGWRVTQLIKKINIPSDRKSSDHPAIQMYDATFTLRLNAAREVQQSISVYNTSSEPVMLNSCEVTSNSGLVRCDRTKLNFNLNQETGRFNIYLKIIPKQIGSFVEELIADFGTFKKKCLVTIQVHDQSFSTPHSSRSKNKSYGEMIPGQKVRQSPRFIEIRISQYQIPDELMMIDHKKQTQLVLCDLKQYFPFLFEELRKDNYVSKMRYCLYLEEIAMKIQFERYKISRGHFENRGEYLKLTVDNVAERRPSISLGDTISITDPIVKSHNVVYQGYIHKVEQNAILVKCDRNFHNNHFNRDYQIEFFFSRTCYRRQQHALDKAVALGGLGFDVLFPTIVTANKYPQVDADLSDSSNLKIDEKEFPFFNNMLNVYQKKAVVNVLRAESRPLPYIIYGPPGTGKTATVTECIEQIIHKIPKSRILVAAPSNSAANIIVDRLINTGRYRGGDFVRIVSFNQIERQAIPEHILKYCATIDIGYDDGNNRNEREGESGLRLNCAKSVITQYRIFISTLSSLGSLMHIRFMPDHFTHVIIDEAGQTVETESLIPMTFVSKNKGQIILAGDPKQLGPVIISQIAKASGFDKSYLERISEHNFYLPIYGDFGRSFDPRYVTKLMKNYRAIPSILNIYNKLFYEDELEAQVKEEDSDEKKILDSIKEILWNPGDVQENCGVYFVNVANGKNMRNPESSSWFNNEEASRLYMFVCKLKLQGISLKDVGIITPYALQAKTIRRIIQDSIPESGIKVGTVEEFQGQERQIILISTVRTSDTFIANDELFNLGFLNCPKRMNVAISRARALLVIFGKESVLRRDDNWRFFIQYTKDRGSYVTV